MRPWYREVLQRGDGEVRAQVAQALLQQRKPPDPDCKGCVVEFLRGGHLRCGVVRSSPARSRYWWILDQEGRESRLSRGKIVDISRDRIEPQERGEMARALCQMDRCRQNMKDEVDLRVLWEVVDEDRARAWSLEELAGLYFSGEPSSDSRAALARALSDGSYFSRQARGFVPMPAEVVERRERAASQRRQRQDRLAEAGLWLRQVADGSDAPAPAGVGEAIELLEGVALFGSECERASQAAELMKTAHLHGPLAAFRVLVKLGHWDEDENVELRRSGAPTEFSPAALEEADLAGWSPAAQRCRRWWGRQVFGFSADGSACDAAFSVRRTVLGYVVGIHFSSPVLLLTGGGRVQNEALERGVGLDLPDRDVPLVPASLSAAVCLTSAERRPALTVEVRFDRQWRRRSYEVCLRRVRPRRILRWDEVDAAAAADPHLLRLWVLATSLRRERGERGTLGLLEPEIRPVARGGKVAVQRREASSASSVIGAELTALAADLAGQFCARHEIPGIYAVEPVPAGVAAWGDEYDPVRVHAHRKALPRPALQTAPGSDGATRLTVDRPLHRYADLLVHQQLASCLAGGTPVYTREELEHGLDVTAWAREAAVRVQGWARRYWLLKYLEDRRGEDLEAVVLIRAGTGFLVELCETGLKVFLPGGREAWAGPGDRIVATLGRVSARRDVIDLSHPRPARA